METNIKRGRYVLYKDGTYRDPMRYNEWKLSVELIKLLYDAGWRSPNSVPLDNVSEAE